MQTLPSLTLKALPRAADDDDTSRLRSSPLQQTGDHRRPSTEAPHRVTPTAALSRRLASRLASRPGPAGPSLRRHPGHAAPRRTPVAGRRARGGPGPAGPRGAGQGPGPGAGPGARGSRRPHLLGAVGRGELDELLHTHEAVAVAVQGVEDGAKARFLLRPGRGLGGAPQGRAVPPLRRGPRRRPRGGLGGLRCP